MGVSTVETNRDRDRERPSSIYYFRKSGAGRFPSLMLDSIDDFRQTNANAVDGEVRKKRKDVT
jgi:hypothetical protein